MIKYLLFVTEIKQSVIKNKRFIEGSRHCSQEAVDFLESSCNIILLYI